MRFGVLGPLEVNGAPFRAGAKQRVLLLRLLLARGAAVPVDALIDALWPAKPPASAAHAIQVHLSALRKTGLELAREGEGYRLVFDELDAAELERAVDAARSARDAGRSEDALASLEAALGLWRGPALAGFESEPVAQAEIERLEELRVVALEERVTCGLALGVAPDLPALEALAAEHPLRERLQGALMLALYRSGRQTEALDVHRRAREALAELGLEPGPDLRALQGAILRQDDGLDVEPEAVRQRRHLPAPATALVGRRDEIDELIAALRGATRLLTLTGAGGIGKTRLALQVAHELAGAFADGVWFVGLAPLADAAFVEAAVAEALELRDVSLEAHLSGRELLLLLDNFEHVADAAPLVSRLLTAAPRLKVLATSRSRLDLYGELDYPVPPLQPEEATTLFLERARAARHGFATGAGVEELCRRFDRLPLALELVAARARDLTLDELVDSAGLDLAAGGPRDLPERQQTLRSAIAWSEERLGPEQRHLFAQLGVFAGGFEPDALEAVRPGGAALLGPLVDTALVHRGSTGRLRMLATVRDYARERLEAAGADEARRRHLSHFAALAEELAPKLLGAGDADAHATLERERDNLRAALSFARDRGHPEALLGLVRDLSRFWYVRGSLAEGASWAEAALAGGGEAPGLLRAQALKGAALLDWRRGELSLAEERAEEARTLIGSFGEEGELLGPLSILGAIAYSRGDTAGAQARFEEGAELAERLGRLPYLSIALNNLAGLHYESRNWEGARRAYEASIATAREQGSQELEGFALYGLGAVGVHEGRLDLAERQLVTSLAIFDQLGFPDRIASCCIYLAGVASARGDADAAARLLGAAEGYRQAAETTTDRLERESADEARAESVAALGADAFAAAFAAGRAGAREIVGDALAGRASNLRE